MKETDKPSPQKLKHKETENELYSLIDGVKDYAIFKLTTEGIIASWNEGAKNLKGYSREEIIGKHFSIFYPKEKRDVNFPEYELEHAKKHGRFEDEGWRIKKDGSSFWANVVLTAIKDENDQVIGFTKITRDLTERKKAEEALRSSEERLRSMISSVKDYAIFMLNPDGTIATWNEGAKRFKGYTENEIIGKHFRIFYPQEKQEIKFPEYELEQARKIGRFEDEGIRIRKDGSAFWANVVITAIYNDKKELLGFTKVTRDLTEKRQQEEALKQSEERFRSLVEGVKDYAIFIVDPQGKINSWNEGAKRLKGYTEDEILGKHISIFYTKEKQDSHYPDYELEQAKKFGRFEDEGLRVKKDGSTFYANVVITALFDKDKKHIGFSKITRDLTERKAFEENLQQMNKELEHKVEERTEQLKATVDELTKINNDLDNFIYTASHDLKAPVSNIEGLFQGLFEELGNEAKNNENVVSIKKMIEASITRFQKTITQLTHIAKIQKELTEDAELVDLNEVVTDVEINIHDLIVRNNAEINCNFNGYSSIKFVRKNIYSIFYNFISNGIKYKSPERKPVITIVAGQEGNYRVFSFTDNGLGLKEENQAKMFTMFKRFHDHVEGTGVGLYIVKKVIDNAGGKIEVNSKEGEGTTFKIYLPQ